MVLTLIEKKTVQHKSINNSEYINIKTKYRNRSHDMRIFGLARRNFWSQLFFKEVEASFLWEMFGLEAGSYVHELMNVHLIKMFILKILISEFKLLWNSVYNTENHMTYNAALLPTSIISSSLLFWVLRHDSRGLSNHPSHLPRPLLFALLRPISCLLSPCGKS